MAIVQPWERQPGEPPRAWAAFCVYRDMDPGSRSLAKVGQTFGRSTRWIEHWSVAFCWVRRVQAWESEQDRLRRAGQLMAIEEMGRRQTAIAVLMERHAAARVSRMTDEDVQRMSISDAVRLVEVGARIERLARGVPVDDPPVSVIVDHLPISAFLRAHPSRVGPVVTAVAALRATLPELYETTSKLEPDDEGEAD